MTELTEPQKELVLRLENYDLRNLYNLIGSAAAESGDAAVRKRYVLGTPDLHERGARIVADVKSSVCASRERVEQLIRDHGDTLEPLKWASTIADVVLALMVTPGIPPLAIATALGKLCNRTLSRLCG
jgi:hypothetical protein